VAQRTVIVYHSDLTGVEIGEYGSGLQFSLDGTDYEIDLTQEEQAELREALAPFTAVARRVGGQRPHPRPASRQAQPGEPSSRELRAWAENHGFDVPTRGRIPELVREAYKAAHTQA